MTSILGKRRRQSCNSSPLCTISKRVHLDDSLEADKENELPSTPSRTHSPAEAVSYLNSSRQRSARKAARPLSLITTPSKPITSLFSINKYSVDRSETSRTKPVLGEPITPSRQHEEAQQRVLITPQSRSRRRDVTAPDSDCNTPSTPSKITPYAQARQMFTSCHELESLVGREEERSYINQFVIRRVQASSGGSLYVSGPPGTGKSAFVTNILQHLEKDMTMKKAVINCMSIRNTADLAQILLSAFGIAFSTTTEENLKVLERHCFATSVKESSVIVLDELDHLVELDLELLYSLFQWSLHKKSKLILIGIANALDLTDRVLPGLKSRGLRPELLPFMPYTADQINKIITIKLQSLVANDNNPAVLPLFHPAAISLCSKKVASQTGDLRKAFDIIKRALTLADSDMLEKFSQSSQARASELPLGETTNLASPRSKLTTKACSSQVTALLTMENAPKITIAQIAKITAQIFSNGTSSRLLQLNIQQKAVLCTLAVAEGRARTSLSETLASMAQYVPSTPTKTGRGRQPGPKMEHPSTKQLYDTYSQLCKRDNILHALSSVEFRDILSGLETLSLIEFIDNGSKTGTLGLVTPTKTPKRASKMQGPGQMSLGSVTGSDERKVTSVVGMKEIETMITGPGSEILREILDG